ncbi:ribonuclease III [Hathewaya histolytica]|uniref:Ribonuclease 3 n=1 Tax=Hathewaya histolytica TaxID=1498 RepID=A0A4U9REB5_HATHI|nr:ribonuclease III [Hathewaya histolytica]VTQ90029.1 ribonuclease III [Hathewaya histolytica]
MQKKSAINELEKIIAIDFHNKSLLRTALTHSSYANQRKNISYNERLEYLGDAVLELIISEYLYINCKDKLEGELTKIRATIVCESSLHEIAQKWDLGKFIIMSKGEEQTGGRTRNSILADCVEAIIAAVYLDKGLKFTRKFILDNFMATIERAIKNQIILDYKTKLQELLQKNGEVSISYNLTSCEGPPHRPIFHVEVVINGKSSGKGSGYSKKEAEQNAAKEVILEMEKLYE